MGPRRVGAEREREAGTEVNPAAAGGVSNVLERRAQLGSTRGDLSASQHACCAQVSAGSLSKPSQCFILWGLHTGTAW